MLAIEVRINGKKHCTAGITDEGVVSAILSLVRRSGNNGGAPKREISLIVGGLNSQRREHADWLKADLAEGDEVRIRIVDVRKADDPLKGSVRPVDNGLQSQKGYVRRMAKGFGWKISTGDYAQRGAKRGGKLPSQC